MYLLESQKCHNADSFLIRFERKSQQEFIKKPSISVPYFNIFQTTLVVGTQPELARRDGRGQCTPFLGCTICHSLSLTDYRHRATRGQKGYIVRRLVVIGCGHHPATDDKAVSA
ncbi:unnamed protein product [Protopolystoma xenopodis]|uniref:Uncharacterized protein n=1 Tax=Protopolystoma xenopodis TaxID=117903 RepID=A0A3S5B1Y0_9PLAT|nr:unnamed protein product [Protopolystoma xenopodis]